MNLSWSCPARTVFGLGGLVDWLRTGPVAAPGPIGSVTVLADRAVAGRPVLDELRHLLEGNGIGHEVQQIGGAVDLAAVSALAGRLPRPGDRSGPAGHALVAVGGGSVLDQVAIAAVLQANPSVWTRLSVAQRSGLILLEDIRARLPLVAVPTTIGTGAEASTSACLAHPDGKRLLIGDVLRPDAAVLDPLATRGLPDHLVREGLLEPLFRLGCQFVADAGERPTEDALALALAERLVALGDRLDDALGGPATDPAASDELRRQIAQISALSHAPWLSLGRDRYAARGWYIATELSVALGVRKMTAVAALLPALWAEIDDGRAVLGSADRLRAWWRRLRVAGARPLPADPAAGIAALVGRWRIDPRLPADATAADPVARRCVARWGAGLPMLGRVRTDDLRGPLRRALSAVPDRPARPEPGRAGHPQNPSMDVGARRHRGRQRTDQIPEEVN